jgi:hypothetical protein
MKEKKQIDKLFQERFQNFEATPPPEAWSNIKAQLKKEKEDRKVIPLWWKLGGVAALLALLLTVGNSVFNSGDGSTQLTEEETTPIENTTESTTKDAIITDNKGDDVQVATETDAEQDSSVESDKKVYSNDKSKEAVVSNNKMVETTVAEVDNTNEEKKFNQDKDPLIRDKKIVTNPNEKDAVATKITDKKVSEEKKKTEVDKIQDTNIAKTTSEKIAKTDTDLKKTVTDPLIKDGNQIKNNKTEDAIVAKTDEEKKEDAKLEEKKSIFDAIEENKEVEDAVAKKEGPKNRWEVSPNVAPVYYSSLGNGSSLDPTFADNSQSGDVNLSYGAGVSYAISERLSVRTGINNVNLSYSTGDVELGSGPVSAALRSVNYGGQSGQVLTAVDKGSIRPNPEGGFGVITPKAAGADAFINQSIRYYEVPMELKYALVDTKFGINMIGGFSTLFLGDSEVSVEAGDFRSVLGEANNLNSLSFTTNIGLGFDYKISKRLKFNIEPMFKYQLNPYSDSSVDFNPFYMGVYTGLSFKF